MAELEFDATEVDPAESFSPIPTDNYESMIVDSKMKPTKNKDGSYLELTFQVIDGEFKNRKFWDRLNLRNPSTQAVEIARKTLSAICHAVGVLQVKDSVELHNLPLIAAVRTEEYNGNMGNTVSGYRAKPMPGAVQTGAQPAAPAQNTTAPWQK